MAETLGPSYRWNEVLCSTADGIMQTPLISSTEETSQDETMITWFDEDGSPILRNYLWQQPGGITRCQHYVPVLVLGQEGTP